jgi:hypothetical protein
MFLSEPQMQDAIYFSLYSQLLIIQGNGGEKVMDNPKPWLKQKQSKYDTKWISCKLIG